MLQSADKYELVPIGKILTNKGIKMDVPCYGISSGIFFSRPLFTEQEAYTHSIVVSNLPRDVQEEELREYFERRREHGGGPVKDMRLNTQRGEAIVNFTDYRGIKKANHNAG